MTKAVLITEKLSKHLVQEMEEATTICLLTSFVMKSGVAVLRDSLKQAANRGADIKICTGDYLFVTQPEALKMLVDIHEKIEVRLWKSNGTSFHPKAYLFKREEEGNVVVGSSNLSRSALTTGVEWNISLTDDASVFEEALDQFTKLMYHEQTIPVNKESIIAYEKDYEVYHRKYPELVRIWTEAEEVELMLPVEEEDVLDTEVLRDPSTPYVTEIKPRFAQIQALEELTTTYEEGYKSALVIMATGLGKTYLAAFFAKSFNKVLFIAHREEILHQAKKSFQLVMPDKNYGIYNGKQKEGDADVVFASIYTLSLEQHIKRFSNTDFDLIVVDEFHHAAANSYQRVLDYFKPDFLLGITATPDRNDNKDVYAICNGNVAYRMDFIEAIQRQWLAPFHYYGVYDETDYSQLTWLGNRYAEEELLQVQLRADMAENIYRAWLKHKQTRTIGFCSSIKQADFLAEFFNSKGIKSLSLHSQQVNINRETVIKMLETRDLEVIFTVDLFNEGVDIPIVDTLLFVRPTESLTVFTQQIGRGLRLHDQKEYCVVIDLIGNYRNADVKLSVFQSGDDNKEGKNKIIPSVPITCVIDIESRVINLLDELRKKRQPRKEKLRESFYNLKLELGRRPSYIELHLKGKSNAAEYKQDFKSYFGFLYWVGELTSFESEVYKRFENWFIEVEKTGMSKSYKMVVLLAMLERGKENWTKPITAIEVAPFFHYYLMETPFRRNVDFSDNTTKKLWQYDETKVSKLIVDMPMTKWSGSAKGLVTFDGTNFGFDLNIAEEDQAIVFNWTKQICEYRLHQHFERKSKNFNS